MSFVVLAEMGDKTQLLAMAFATRYKATTVLWAVFWATLLNHLLAVVVGNYLTHFIPIQYIQIAAVSFILFGLWTIRGDELNNEDKRFSFSPFWTVAIAFFIAEMGDKTQLATIALAAKYQSIIPVWLGRGDDALGDTLIRSFIHTLLQLKPLPATIIRYNAGVKLAARDSAALDDLQQLEKAGADTLVCGTCVNCFGLGDQVAVGHISNMYDIAEAMAGAARLVRP